MEGKGLREEGEGGRQEEERRDDHGAKMRKTDESYEKKMLPLTLFFVCTPGTRASASLPRWWWRLTARPLPQLMYRVRQGT